MSDIKPRQKLQADIIRITGDGKGVAYTEDEKLILISGISKNDRVVRVEVQSVFEETIFARKIGSLKSDGETLSTPDVVESPYDIDDDTQSYDDDDYDDDDEYEDEEDY